VKQSHLTRWIEIAEARHACEGAMVDRVPQFSEGHYLHLGEAIAKVSLRIGHSISRESLSAIGHHALARARRPVFHFYQ
jgi:hypothetical protein